MRNIFDKPIPIGLFAIVLMLASFGYVVSFIRQGDHFQRMDEFMNKGDRFTGSEGREMADRIDDLEDRIRLLEENDTGS